MTSAGRSAVGSLASAQARVAPTLSKATISAPQPLQQHLEALAHRRLVLDDHDQPAVEREADRPLARLLALPAGAAPCRPAARA